MRNQDFDGAIADFTGAMKAAKSLPKGIQSTLYVNRARPLELKGDLDAAMTDLDKAIALDSKSLPAYQNRAVLHAKRNELNEAIKDYSKVIKLSATFAYAYRGRGLVLLAQGKDAEAQADFAMFLELNPDGKAVLQKLIDEVKQKRAAKP